MHFLLANDTERSQSASHLSIGFREYWNEDFLKLRGVLIEEGSPVASVKFQNRVFPCGLNYPFFLAPRVAKFEINVRGALLCRPLFLVHETLWVLLGPLTVV